MSKHCAHVNCSIVGCQNKHANVFSSPASLDQTTREQWIKSIFDNNVPVTFPATPHVCASHFAPECFVNLEQYQAKMASSLHLEKGAIPTTRDSSSRKKNPAQKKKKKCKPATVFLCPVLM
uniref:THAP-type domain-containing protein n=1 Tax=Fundulus heteroclitus TaxID=8078 RepID=A0A3Q2SNQ6_FUNHE